jgi:hypothetical protein
MAWDAELPPLQETVVHALVDKGRTLRELASDLPGGDWSIRDISEALLALREAGYVRFSRGAWRTGPGWGKTGHAWVVIKGHGPWDGAAGPLPGELDAAATSRQTMMIRLSSPYGF